MAHAQQGFIYRLDSTQNGINADGRSVFPVDGGYLVLARQIYPGNIGTHFAAYKIDLNGHYVSRHVYPHPAGQSANLIGPLDPAFQNDTGAICMVLDRWYSDQSSDAFIWWLNDEGDTVHSTLIDHYNSEDSLITEHCALRAKNTGFVTAGHFYNSSGPNGGGRVQELGPDGQPLWTFDLLNNGSFYHVEPFPGGGAVACGERVSGGLDGMCVYRIDASGSEMWHRFFGGYVSYYNSLVVTGDSGVVVLAPYREQQWPLGDAQIMLSKWDKNGALQWFKKSHYNTDGKTGDLEVLGDGSFIATGHFAGNGLIAKFSATGDSLWSRAYYISDHADDWIYGLTPTADGGFITAGGSDQLVGDTFPGLTTIWGFKTDSLGCIIPGCQTVGVQLYALDLQPHLHVSPNPVSELLRLDLTLPEGSNIDGPVRAYLLDATGKVVMGCSTIRNLNEVRATMDVGALLPGAYFLHLRDNKSWLAGSRIVVAH